MKISRLLRFGLITILILWMVAPLFAPIAFGAPLENITQVRSKLCDIVGLIYSFALAIGVACILFAAFSYITSGGNSEKVATAGKALMYAIIGIVIAFLATSVPGIIGSILGSQDVRNC